MATLVRTYIEHGPYGDNPLFGAPFSLNTGWASTVDDIHIWVLSALGHIVSDPFTVLAMYYFACFPLSALAMYWLCRKYGVGRPAAVALGVLFSVVPGQQERFVHLFLAAYWAVPFAIYLIIETARGHRILPTRAVLTSSHRRHAVRRLTATVSMLVLLGLGDVYYVAFTALILAAVAVLRQFRGPDLREVGRLAIPAVIMVIPAAVSLWFARQRAGRDEVTGGMAFSRSVADSDRWAGRLMDLVLPWNGHRIPFFGKLTDSYNVVTETQGESAALGLIALAGVVGILGVAGAGILKSRSGWKGPLLAAMAVVLLVAFAFYTKGGLGSWFALFFTPQIRTWSRLFLFIAAIGYLGVGLWLTHLGRLRGRWVAWPLAAAVLVVGVLDQTNPGRAPDYAEQRAHLSELQRFDDSLERTVGAGCPIFVLPVVQFPEVLDESVAEIQSLGLASHDLRWSFGAIKGTAPADWQLGLPMKDATRLLDDLSAVGYCAVVTHDSLPKRQPALSSALASLLGQPVATMPAGTFIAYDLRPNTRALTSKIGKGGVERSRAQVLNPLVVSLSGVWRTDESDPVRFPMGPTPALQLSNMSDAAVQVEAEVTLTAGPEAPQTFTLERGGSILGQLHLAAGETGKLTGVATISPGQTTLDIQVPGALEDLSRYQQRVKLPYITDVRARSSDTEVNVGVNLPQP
ncbi:hypothetical protein [Humibacillus xanthopallidus]|nr:hypothetical protein [Humibacillus xanthopallidus]